MKIASFYTKDAYIQNKNQGLNSTIKIRKNIMRKRNIAFILFGVGAVNIVTLPILLFVYGPLYQQLGMPPYASTVGLMTSTITTVVAASALFIAGIIVFIKFRKT